MIGQKGLPATFGGIEHHVEELGARLAEEGIEVTVYCRASYAAQVDGGMPERYRGMRLVTTPTVPSKHLDAIVHSLTSTVHAIASGHDIIHYHALGPGLVAPVARYASRAKVVLTVHGLDHQRAKWGGPAQNVLALAHWMSGHVPDAVITVSQTLAEHYRSHFGVDAAYIPNGVSVPTPGPLPERLRREFGLEPGGYVLFVGRIVPEKRPDLLVDALAQIPEDIKVAIVGDSSFSDEYVERLRAAAASDRRIVFPGFLYGAELGAVYSNAVAFVQPSDLEGLPLTLLEGISYGLPVVASDIAPHHEVLDACDCGGHRLFRAGDSASLAEALTGVLEDPELSLRSARMESAELLRPYRWAQAGSDLANLYRKMLDRR
jgi:glycosyltransferase involved in cell wall biosynthesis